MSFWRGKSLGWKFWLLLLETLHIERLGCWEKKIIQKSLRFLCIVSFQFFSVLFPLISKISKEDKMFYWPNNSKPDQKKKKAKQKARSLQSVWLWPCLSDSPFTVQKSWNHTDYHHICLSFCFLLSAAPSSVGEEEGGLVGWLLVCHGVTLHGLSTQQISRQQGVNRRGAPNHTGVLSTWRAPQAGVLGHSTPKKVSSAGLASAAPLADRVGLRCSHPVLIGSLVGLPASGVCPQWLALCKEAVHLLLPSKLCQNGGVSKYTP